MAEAPKYPGMPRWVKVLAIVALIIVAHLVVVGLVLGGGHGPQRHLQPHDAHPADAG